MSRYWGGGGGGGGLDKFSVRQRSGRDTGPPARHLDVTSCSTGPWRVPPTGCCSDSSVSAHRGCPKGVR